MFELATPWILLLLPLPLLLWLVLPAASQYYSVALKVPFYQAISKIIQSQRTIQFKGAHLGLFFLLWCLLLLAAAGPRWVGEMQPMAREGRNIMLVLDLSGSMALDDMLLHGQPATRLAVVKMAAKQFVEARLDDHIGLILFGSLAYLQTPLTYDHHNILLRLEDATVGLAGQTTSLGDALGLAIKRLQGVSSKGRIIILLTDGANNSGVLAPLKAAELAQMDDIKVYTIGLGAVAQAGAFSGFFPVNTSADLDEDTLEAIAKLTGGHYFRATDSQSLHAIYSTINQLETVKQEEASIRPQKEYYPWPLALAVLLFLYWLASMSMAIALNKARLG